VALDELEDCLASSSTVESELDANRLAELFDDFLDGLDKENRVMFVRRYWFSESISDIAARFGMNEHAVSARLLRIREKLRRYLSEKGVAI
jgi:RNA polymerase sigma-70 factor (ECF subfamily)